MSRAEQRAMGDITHVLEESIGHKVVKVFGGQEYEMTRLDAAANKVRRFQHEAWRSPPRPTCR